jgi:hypothetical protein
MERIEVPATIYWKSKFGKKFTNQEDCEKYERLYDKWQVPELYREFENVEGQLCYAYWIESKEELDEVIWLTWRRLDTSTCNYVSVDNRVLEPQWIIVCPSYNEYNSEMAIRTMKDFREEIDDIIKAALETNETLAKLIWEKV